MLRDFWCSCGRRSSSYRFEDELISYLRVEIGILKTLFSLGIDFEFAL
jgi:hypothetical protein